MPEIEIRPASQSDAAILSRIDHGYQSSYVWQMDRALEDGQIQVNFRQVRLPRPVRVEFTGSLPLSEETWPRFKAVLVASINHLPVGYISMVERGTSRTLWVTDCAVQEDMRRKGIGTALVLAGQEWAGEKGWRKLIVEMQSKNHPAIQMVRKLGFDFCGYNDNYFQNQDIGLFFARSLR
jgi:ribosomal protein S18 acetylase RimI-like enzyme